MSEPYPDNLLKLIGNLDQNWENLIHLCAQDRDKTIHLLHHCTQVAHGQREPRQASMRTVHHLAVMALSEAICRDWRNCQDGDDDLPNGEDEPDE